MKKNSLKNKLYKTLMLGSGFLIFFWILLLLPMNYYARLSAQTMVEQMADISIHSLQESFLDVEQVSQTLIANKEVIALVKEKEPLDFHKKVGTVQEFLKSLSLSEAVVSDVLILNQDGMCGRLRGEIGNTAVSRVSYLMQNITYSSYQLVTLEGHSYIAYGICIYEGNRSIGYLVFLMNNENLHNMFSTINKPDNMLVGLEADGTLIVANDFTYNSVSIESLKESHNNMMQGQIGLTPFSIFVMDQGAYSQRISYILTLGLIMTVSLLACIMFLFYKHLNKMFFAPMLKVMGDTLDIGSKKDHKLLGLTGQLEFDKMIAEINTMIGRLEKKNADLLHMQYQVQQNEIEKQKSIVVALKKQIDAHFTVNTLNVIGRLSERKEHEKAAEMSRSLAGLLAYANGGEEEISIIDEIYILRSYGEIMSIRYPNHFSIEFEIDDELMDNRISRMLVQPLLENAIVHGILKNNQGDRIVIRFQKQNDSVVISVKDNGQGIDTDTLSRILQRIEQARAGTWHEDGLDCIAIPNIQKRVSTLYGKEYGLSFSMAEQQGTEALLILPFI